jgi:hypothetical protein
MRKPLRGAFRDLLVLNVLLSAASASGCAAFGPSEATCSLRFEAPGRAGLNMENVLSEANAVLVTQVFRDDIERDLSRSFTLPHDWPQGIKLGTNQEEMLLLVRASMPNPRMAADVANFVARRLQEGLKKGNKYRIDVYWPAR